MSHEDEPIFSLTDGLLALALVLCVLALLIHKLLAPTAASYAATAPPPKPPPVYADDTAMIMRSEHAILAAQFRERAYLAWRAQVVLDAKLKAAKIKAQRAQVAAQSSGPISTMGFSAFKACVAMRESTDGRGSSNIFGILGGLWPGVPNPQVDPWYPLASKYPNGAGSAPYWVQSKVFDMIYAQQGTAPWAPYDGC